MEEKLVAHFYRRGTVESIGHIARNKKGYIFLRRGEDIYLASVSRERLFSYFDESKITESIDAMKIERGKMYDTLRDLFAETEKKYEKA